MLTCPHCHQEIPPDSRYCSHCGRPLIPAPPAGTEPDSTPGPGGELTLGEYLKTGWQLFKLYPGGFIGFTVLYFLLGVVLHGVPVVGPIAFMLAHTPLAAGYLVVHGRLLTGQPVEFGHFFAGFQSHRLLPLILLGVVDQVLITLGLLLLILPGIYLAVAYMFASLILLDRGRDFWPALEESRRAVTPRWFGFFAFFLLLLLLNLAGLLCLGVGLVITFPVTYGAVTAAYARLFGLSPTFS
ncbi:MAG: zinc ribbon domain-containing protein [Syntrophobacterales bacterium]|nr:zinc ribbon domain-containing protein [Syntrophobacterales bacterium]